MNENKRMTWEEFEKIQEKRRKEDHEKSLQILRTGTKVEIIGLTRKRNPFSPELVNRR